MKAARLRLHQSQNIINLYNQEVIIHNGIALECLSQAKARDNGNLARMTKETQKDSRTMRIVTVVALIYLPANVVLVRISYQYIPSMWNLLTPFSKSFFSTELVSFQATEPVADATSVFQMKVHSQVWIPIVLTLLLTTRTLAAVSIIDRRAQKHRISGLIRRVRDQISQFCDIRTQRLWGKNVILKARIAIQW